jgi:hypothetical protein
MTKAIRAAACAAAMGVAVAAWAQAPAAKPLATSATNIGDGVSIDLMSVERHGSILTVKWQVRNAATKAVPFVFTLTGPTPSTYAVDEESGTKYYVLTDKEKHTLASEDQDLGYANRGINDNVAAGATNRYWMKLPAPPPAVKAISIFFTKAEPFESVAISDK